MLTRLQVENAKPQDKPVRLFDGRGLYLEVATNGSRYWRFKYRFAGKEKRLSLGVYPEVGIKEARDRREDARKLVQSRIDPAEQRKAEKLAVIEKTENTFEAIAASGSRCSRPDGWRHIAARSFAGWRCTSSPGSARGR
jgi:hypothetical protein